MFGDMSFETMEEKEFEFIIFQLGTNNWQIKDEPAPGSGILHQAHHNAYNRMKNVTCFSLYPSGRGVQTTELYFNEFEKNDPRRNLVRIASLKEDIPICEANGPVSHRRWHSMTSKERFDYFDLMATMCQDFLNDIETKYKPNNKINLIIVHHTFMNPVIMSYVLQRRSDKGLYVPPVAVFIHGTAVKMYQHELKIERKEEFSLKETPLSSVTDKKYATFHEWITKELKLFNGDSKFKPCIGYAISHKSLEAFESAFPIFPKKQLILSPNGIDTHIVKAIPNATIVNVLKDLKTFPIDNSNPVNLPLKSPNGNNWEQLIVYVGRMADWKRPDSLLYAIDQIKDKYHNAVTIMVGQGSHQQNVKIQTLCNEKLKLNDRIFFVGQQMMSELSMIYSAANIGVFPSKDEPFGMVFIECMMCGTPVIGCNSGGPRDFMIKDENDQYLTGILVDESDDHKELGLRIAKQIDNAFENNWKKLMYNQCTKLASGFTVDSQCQKLLKDTKKTLGLLAQCGNL